MTKALLILVASAAALPAAAVSADSARGAQLFQSLACVQCHSVNGAGGTLAPDLGRRLDRNFTPASLAATMWNHAPTMWAAMRERDIPPGDLNDQAAADLFAYFYSARFFEPPGDAARGKRLFSVKHCAECHGLTAVKNPQAPPVSQWQSASQPMALVDAMWNHASNMRQEFQKRHLAWPELTSQDLEDILVYVRNLPSASAVVSRIEITSGASGAALFDSKGCAHCHTGKLELPPRLKNRTLLDIAVAMWNHEPKMPATPLSPDDMRELVSYLWAGQFFQNAGNPAAGERVFTAKHCAACHNDRSSGAPQLTGAGRAFTAPVMVSALWHHGPRMLGQLKARNLPWPRFDGREMANLIAYLNGPRSNNGK